MLDDGKEGEGGGLPPDGLGGQVTHFWDVPNKLRGLETGLGPAEGEDRQSQEWSRGAEGVPEGAVWGSRAPSDWDPPPSGE